MTILTATILGAALVAPASTSGQITSVPGMTAPAPNFSDGVLAPSGSPLLTAQQAVSLGASLNGDAYSAAVLGENSTNAFFLDDFPDDFLFDGTAQNGGDHLATGAGTSVIEFITQTGPNSFLYQVNAFTNDGSDWLPANLVPSAGAEPLSVLRMDVGDFAVLGTLPGDDPVNDSRIVSIKEAVFGVVVDGDIFTFEMAADTSSAGALSGVGLVGQAAGQGVSEVLMAWEVNYVPAPGSLALVGLSGLVAISRRRR